MNNNDIEKQLNNISQAIFKPPLRITFKINELEQIIVTVQGIPHLSHINKRISKKTDSKRLITNFKRTSSSSAHVNIIMTFLTSITGTTVNWNEYVSRKIEIEDKIIYMAIKTMYEHIESVKEIYLDSIEEQINELDIDIILLNKFWKEHIVSQYNVLENIDSFRSYSEVNNIEQYPYLIISSKTGEIRLTKESTGHFIKVNNNNSELSKIKETDQILFKYGNNIKKCIMIQKYIKEIRVQYLSKLENTNEVREYGNLIRYEDMLKDRIWECIHMDSIDGTITLYNLIDKKNDYSIYRLPNPEDENDIVYYRIKEIIEHIYNEILNLLYEKINELDKKYNKEYAYEILNLIEEFPLERITTYVSILHGEENDEILENKYKESLFYGSMSDYKNSFINEKINEFIEDGSIRLGYYKDSFGIYRGLRVNEESREYIKRKNILGFNNETGYTTKKITSIKLLISELKNIESITKAESVLVSLLEEDIVVSKADLKQLLTFIKENRSIYINYEDIFVENISKIIPSEYSDIFLLNSNMITDVTKNVFKSIYENMKNIQNTENIENEPN